MPNAPSIPPAELAAIHLSRTMMYALRELYRLFEGDIAMAIVLGELGEYASIDHYRASGSGEATPRTRRSNAHSIAAASGIPRETVRRKLDKLIAKGWISELPNGGLVLNRELDTPLSQHFLDYNRELLSQMRRTVRTLDGIEI